MIKKLALIASLMGVFASAQALEVGINDGTNLSSTQNVWGVTVGETVKGYNLTAGFNRSTTADSYSLVNDIEVAKMGPVSLDAKFGLLFIDSQSGPSSDGYAAVVGVGARLPITKSVTAGLDYSYQAGQDRVVAENGSRITAGLKFSF